MHLYVYLSKNAWWLYNKRLAGGCMFMFEQSFSCSGAAGHLAAVIVAVIQAAAVLEIFTQPTQGVLYMWWLMLMRAVRAPALMPCMPYIINMMLHAASGILQVNIASNRAPAVVWPITASVKRNRTVLIDLQVGQCGLIAAGIHHVGCRLLVTEVTHVQQCQDRLCAHHTYSCHSLMATPGCRGICSC